MTLAFAGDTYFEGRLGELLAADPASVLAPMAPTLAGADLAVVNMETALGTEGSPEPKQFTFRAPPSALAAYRAAGVDVVSAANNHGLDFGPGLLDETLRASWEFGVPIVGLGRDEDEAYAPFVADVGGHRVAVIGATQVLDEPLIDSWTATSDHAGLASAKRTDRLVRAVTDAGAVADTVVVFLHWGVEGERCPTDTQQFLAQALVDAGADVVVGGHAHRLQGGGRLGGAVVAYGLGNFAFVAGGIGAETGVLEVTVGGEGPSGYQWVPARIEGRQPVPLDGDESAGALADWHELRACTNLVP